MVAAVATSVLADVEFEPPCVATTTIWAWTLDCGWEDERSAASLTWFSVFVDKARVAAMGSLSVRGPRAVDAERSIGSLKSMLTRRASSW